MDERTYGWLVYGLIVGLIGGAFPLIIGFKRGRYVFAILGFLATLACGLLFGRLGGTAAAMITSAGISNLQNRRRPTPRRDPWDEPGY